MDRILILGGGFAGITAAEMLSDGASTDYEITVVSPSRKFTFFPALVPMVFGDIRPEDIRAEVVPALHQRRIRFIEGEVLQIDAAGRKVLITGNDIDGTLQYDYLLIAIGRRLATEAVPGFFEHAQHLLGLGAATRFKQAISEFAGGSIVTGLCPGSSLPIPACESALALADRFKDSSSQGPVSITAVFPETLENALAGTGLFRGVEQNMRSQGIELVENFEIERVEQSNIFAKDGRKLPYDLAMLLPPFSGQTPVQKLFPDQDAAGFAPVNNLLQVEGFERVYAAGDIVELQGPRFGYMAMRQAKVAAANILIELSGEEPNVEYIHDLAWILSEEYTHPYFFHYGVWDETLQDFDPDALLGIAKRIRERYGHVRMDKDSRRDPAQVAVG